MAAKEMISLRVWRSDLEAWKEAAKREGLDRSSWMNKTLNEVTGRTSTSGESASAATEAASSQDSARTIHPGDSVSIAEAGEQSKSSQ